jgi:CheY-like chemotaxis protein
MNPSIVIVDDSRAIQAIIRRSIEALGYRGAHVQAHSSAQSALDALDHATPDLVITDWHMPGMSGLELLQTLRQTHGKDIKVGVVTTESSPDLLRQARDQGVAFILSKPFTDAELRDGLEKAIGPPGQPGLGAPPRPGPTAALAEPATEAAPAADSAPVVGRGDDSEVDRTDRLSATLAATLGVIKFRLVPSELPVMSLFTARLMLGLYSLSTTKTAYALGLLDLNCVCMIGGGALGLQPSEVRPAIGASSPSLQMIERASAFMREAAPVLVDARGEVPAASRGTLVPRELQRLSEALASNRGLLSYRLQIPGYGAGRLAFILL